MSDIVKDRDRVSRKELAQFVVEQFNSLVRVRTKFLSQMPSMSSLDLIISGDQCEIIVKLVGMETW